MLLFHRPDDEFIRDTVVAQRDAYLTYDYVGWTKRSAIPYGFSSNHWKAVIGNGEPAFQRAKVAMTEYRMLDLGWIQKVGPSEPIVADSLVCTLVRQLGIYSLNVARIVYVENQSSDRFGFGYGTLPEYPLIGEERFIVELEATSNNVTFEILSFSRPKSVLLSMARPLVCRAQRRFCIDSVTAMRAYCKS